jgi:hypothetical protein
MRPKERHERARHLGDAHAQAADDGMLHLTCLQAPCPSSVVTGGATAEWEHRNGTACSNLWARPSRHKEVDGGGLDGAPCHDGRLESVPATGAGDLGGISTGAGRRWGEEAGRVCGSAH